MIGEIDEYLNEIPVREYEDGEFYFEVVDPYLDASQTLGLKQQLDSVIRIRNLHVVWVPNKPSAPLDGYRSTVSVGQGIDVVRELMPDQIRYIFPGDIPDLPTDENTYEFVEDTWGQLEEYVSGQSIGDSISYIAAALGVVLFIITGPVSIPLAVAAGVGYGLTAVAVGGQMVDVFVESVAYGVSREEWQAASDIVRESIADGRVCAVFVNIPNRSAVPTNRATGNPFEMGERAVLDLFGPLLGTTSGDSRVVVSREVSFGFDLPRNLSEWASQVDLLISHSNTAPIARSDSFSAVTEISPCTYALENTVLTNDFDADGDGIRAILAEEPPHGELTLRESGSFTYIIDPSKAESTFFSYYVEDPYGTQSSIARVDLHVSPSPVGHAPELQVSEPALRNDELGRASAFFTVVLSDADFLCLNTEETVKLYANAEGMSFSVLADTGGWMPWDSNVPIAVLNSSDPSSMFGLSRMVRFTLPERMSEWAAEFEAVDATLNRVGERVIFKGGNWYPETLIAGKWVRSGQVSIGGRISSGEPMILALEPAWYEAGCLQFRDLDGDALTFRVSQMPRLGTANLMTSGSGGNYFVTVLYEVSREAMLACHVDHRELVDQLTVQATDPQGGIAEAEMMITLDVINSDPVCVDDDVTTPMETAVEFNVLGNDSDVDGDVLSVVAVGGATFGASSVSDNTIRYVPDNGFYGDDTFTYTAEDGYGGSGEAMVTVHVVDTEPPVF
ncbi:MAG: hypothetical protein E4H08_10945, partial [Candidatus Atribacteria bacterium]